MNVTYESAVKTINEAYPDSHIVCAMQVPSGYVFSIKPNDWDDNSTLLDGFFKVSTTDGKLTEYSPVMDPEEFGLAINNPIYVKK